MSDNDLQDQAANASTATFITALATNLIVAAVEIAIFTILRPHFRAIYEPRSYIPDEPKRVSPLTAKGVSAYFGWPVAIWNADYKDIKRVNSLDAYFFVRFLRMMTRVFFPLWLLSWALFLPLHGAGVTNNRDGLDRFTFGNISVNQQARYAAHIIFIYGMVAWICYNIKKEMRNFISTRQRHLVDPEHSKSAQANTVLFTGVPRKFLDEQVLAQLFTHVPGGSKAIWLNRDLKEMPDIYTRREKACKKLEGAEKDLAKLALKLQAKGKGPATETSDSLKSQSILAEKFVPREKRPTHRTPPFSWLPFGLPFMGEKVDTIDWCKQEIVETNRLLAEARETLQKDIDQPGTGEDETYPPLNSAFVLFNQQIGAHMAAQALIHHEPYRMAAKYTEVAVDDVIWGNLGLNPYEQKIRLAISYGLTAGLIIVWAIPVAFVGIISNVYGLCVKYSWLAWLCDLPKVVVGLLQGVLPPVLLAVLMALLPIVLRLFAQFEGIPTRSGIELSLMTRYFIFQVIHSFLIVTISGGLIQALPQLSQNPGSAATLLAQNLPSAATFFVTYIVLQMLSGVAGGLLQVGPLVVYYVKLFILGSTPRSIYAIKYTLRNVAWGTLFPAITLITVIAISYTPLQPVVTGFACATFFLLSQLWKYLFLYQLEQPPSGDTGGLFFPKAIQHLFVGMYVMEVCLCALFFLARNANGDPSAIPQGALMVVLIVITVGYNIIINNSYGPLLHSLPLSLAHKSYGMAPEGVDMPTSSDPNIKAEELRADQEDQEAAIRRKQQADATAEDQHHRDLERNGAHTENDGDVDDENDVQSIERKQDTPTDFNHPATVGPQPTIWLAKDSLGIGEDEVRGLRDMGISASTERAVMNEKGKVKIDGAPPEDEDIVASAH